MFKNGSPNWAWNFIPPVTNTWVLGPMEKRKKRLKRGDPGKNRLDRIAKQHDIDYSKAKNIRDKWKADEKMVKAIDRLPGKKSVMERVARGIIKTKKRLHL